MKSSQQRTKTLCPHMPNSRESFYTILSPGFETSPFCTESPLISNATIYYPTLQVSLGTASRFRMWPTNVSLRTRINSSNIFTITKSKQRLIFNLINNAPGQNSRTICDLGDFTSVIAALGWSHVTGKGSSAVACFWRGIYGLLELLRCTPFWPHSHTSPPVPCTTNARIFAHLLRAGCKRREPCRLSAPDRHL